MITIAVGAQGGDEGKGKIIDFLAEKYDLTIRFQGGNNAGHTVINDKGVFHMHLIPSGIFNHDGISLIGTGMVVDPEKLIEEMDMLQSRGVDISNLRVSGFAHILMPYHVLIDQLNEKKFGIIDTTKRGIGPAYADRALRENLRFEDLFDLEKAYQKLQRIVPRINNSLKYYDCEQEYSAEQLLKKCKDWKSKLAHIIVNPNSLIHEYIAQDKNILFEGQLGIFRDIDIGTYPYVTSSNPTAAYACVSSGIPIKKVDSIIGIMRAYPILAGNGPFPTEMEEDVACHLRGSGNHVDDEYGVTTGRPRRIGWLDLPCLRYSNSINGYNELALCKLDKYDDFDTIRICNNYLLDGKVIDYFPSTDELERVVPQYIEIKGWKRSTRKIRERSDLPKEALHFLEIIERDLNVPIRYIAACRKRSPFGGLFSRIERENAV